MYIPLFITCNAFFHMLCTHTYVSKYICKHMCIFTYIYVYVHINSAISFFKLRVSNSKSNAVVAGVIFLHVHTFIRMYNIDERFVI